MRSLLATLGTVTTDWQHLVQSLVRKWQHFVQSLLATLGTVTTAYQRWIQSLTTGNTLYNPYWLATLGTVTSKWQHWVQSLLTGNTCRLGSYSYFLMYLLPVIWDVHDCSDNVSIQVIMEIGDHACISYHPFPRGLVGWQCWPSLTTSVNSREDGGMVIGHQ